MTTPKYKVGDRAVTDRPFFAERTVISLSFHADDGFWKYLLAKRIRPNGVEDDDSFWAEDGWYPEEQITHNLQDSARGS